MILADTPFAWWRLDEASGTFADSSGNSRSMAVTSGTPTYSQPSAVAGGGTSVIKNSGFWTPALGGVGPSVVTAGVSLEVWFKINAMAGADAFLYDSAKFSAGYGFYLTTTGLAAKVYPAGVLNTVTYTYTYSTNTWHHFVFVFERGGTDRLKLYLDGVLVANNACSNTGQDATAQAGPIAGANSSGSLPFNGGLDELAIYGYDLSATKVAAHYAAGAPPVGNSFPGLFLAA